MPMKTALESALNAAADDADTWIAGKNVFWQELQENDATLGSAIYKALFRVCGEDRERLFRCREIFFELYRGKRSKTEEG